MKIKVSVIVPVYNVELYINECVDSILNQTLKDIEIILVDDGSDDSSGEILDDYDLNNDQIQVIHKQNGGVSAARNAGLGICTGEYIYIMDSDDYLEKDALETMYKNAIETEADVVISDHFMFREDKIQIPHHLFSNEFVTEDEKIICQIQNMDLYPTYSPFLSHEDSGMGIAPPWTKLLKRELVINNNLNFDPYVQGIFDDGLFTLSVFQFANKVSYIPKCLYHYRILKTSLIHRFNPKRKEINKKIFQRIEEFYSTYKKDENFKLAYYARIILNMVNLYLTYYFHRDYKGSIRQNYKEFKAMMKSEPYLTAIQNVDIHKLNKTQKLVTFFARFHLYLLIWLIFKVGNTVRTFGK